MLWCAVCVYVIITAGGQGMEQTAGNLFSQVAEQGAIFALMSIMLIAAGVVIRTLYTRNQEIGDKTIKAITDNTVTINNNTRAIEALEKEIARSNV